MSAHRSRQQEGQILVMALFVMAFLFVPLAVYVIDSGLVEASYVQFGETLQAAAEDGASSVDVAAVRQSGGQVLRLDPAEARVVVDRSLRSSQLPGLESWTVDVRGDSVIVTAHMRVRLLVLGTATLTQTKEASFAVGT
jgi:hypothetical protein